MEECGRLLNTASTVRGISARASVSAPWSVSRTSASAAGLEFNLSGRLISGRSNGGTALTRGSAGY